MRTALALLLLTAPAGAAGRALLPAQGLEGLGVDRYWTREGDAVVGARKDGGAFLELAPDWKDFDLSFEAVVREGGNLDVGFRATRTRGLYFKLLLGRQACALTERDFTGKLPLNHLSLVACELERGKPYKLRVLAQGGAVKAYLDGKLVVQATDVTPRAGRAYLEVWEGAAAFRDLRVTSLEGPFHAGRPLAEWLELLGDEKRSEEAGGALLAIGRPAVPGIAARLEPKNAPLTRAAAATVLWKLRQQALQAVRPLEKALRDDPDVVVRLRAAQALTGVVGPGHKDAVAFLKAASADPKLSDWIRADAKAILRDAGLPD